MLSHFSSSRVWAIIFFELTRLFASKRGLVVLSAFVCVWLLIFYFIIGYSADFISSNNFKDIAQQTFSELNLLTLLEWELPELTIYWLISAYLLPTFALLFSYDQTCSDRERGTLRFILLRASRSELLYGRFFGQVFIVCTLIFITLLASLFFSLINQQSVSMASLILSVSILLKLIIITLPFIASMSLINVLVKSAKMSLVVYFLIYIASAIVIGLLNDYVMDLSYLFYFFPGEQIESTIGFDGNYLNEYVIPLTQTLVYLLIAQYVFKRSSL